MRRSSSHLKASAQLFRTRIQRIWWLYSIGRMFAPGLVLSGIGLVFALARRGESWASRLFSEYTSGRQPAVSDMPVRYVTRAPDEPVLPLELEEVNQKTYSEVFEFANSIGDDLARSAFILAVFEYEILERVGNATRSCELLEIFERRNVYAHRAGLADEDYLNALSKSKLAGSLKCNKVGDSVITDRQVLIESLAIMLDSSRRI